MKRIFIALLIFAGAAMFGCGNPAPTLVSVGIVPVNPVVGVNTQVTFEAIGNYSDGSFRNITGACGWNITENSYIATWTGPATDSSITLVTKSTGTAEITVTDPHSLKSAATLLTVQ